MQLFIGFSVKSCIGLLVPVVTFVSMSEPSVFAMGIKKVWARFCPKLGKPMGIE